MKRDKAVQFKKLAEARTNKACATLKLIGNLSRKASYEYDDEDVEKMFARLQKALDKAKERFVRPDNARFSLSEEHEERDYEEYRRTMSKIKAGVCKTCEYYSGEGCLNDKDNNSEECLYANEVAVGVYNEFHPE